MTAPTETEPRILAVLGPTNTGKTYLAVERMLGHESGMIGLPLRLLAREVYDRVAALKGPKAVALVTGEEKVIPPRPRYFVCTVESMPLDKAVAFLAVDEIQLAADPERGHVFTDRLLRARGLEETMFLGAETIRPLLRRRLAEAAFISRPRFSRLTYTGPKKLSRLPPRSAAIAFSAPDVYALAETLRRRCGGTAVVLGALSPRTRNAQVGMYQAGEVDYLVATDAIGMGLNMDVNHVAFTALRKFDGASPRDLRTEEAAQIAGRAGRHMNDGTFGPTAGLGALDPALVEAVENHRFPPLERLQWRSTALSFDSVKALMRSLEAPPPSPGLVRAREADDHSALKALARDDRVTRLAANPAAVRLLWEVCQIPDYRQVMVDAHVRLLGRIYLHLMGPRGRLAEDWVARSIDGLDRTEGDIDTLTTRIAHIRTWTYVAYRPSWLADAASWQGRAREVEDRLSDALHDRLTRRFVDRRTAVLVRHGREQTEPLAAVNSDGSLAVEGHFVGRLEGFRFVPDESAHGDARRIFMNAARRALRAEIGARVAALAGECDSAFTLDSRARVLWRSAPVARLARGASVFKPRLELISSDLLEGPARERVRLRLQAWVKGKVRELAGPLLQAREASLSPPARGLVFTVTEALGGVPTRQVARQVKALAPEDRKRLAGLGLRLGRETVYFAPLLKSRRLPARALLWAVYEGRGVVPPTPAGGEVSISVDPTFPSSFYLAIGYRPLGSRAVRVDMLERLAVELRRRAKAGPFAADPSLYALAGCGAEALAEVVAGLGYVPLSSGADGEPRFERRGADARRPRRRRARRRRVDPDSPFAKLASLDLRG
ncbi:MAG: helicase-related protein [Alphaproteobacteria bacterium]